MHPLGRARALAAEHQDVLRPEGRIAVTRRRLRGQQDQARARLPAGAGARSGLLLLARARDAVLNVLVDLEEGAEVEGVDVDLHLLRVRLVDRAAA